MTQKNGKQLFPKVKYIRFKIYEFKILRFVS